MGNQYPLLWHDKWLALCLAGPLRRRGVLGRLKLNFFTLPPIWIARLSHRQQLRNVCNITLQHLRFVRHVLQRHRSWRDVNCLCCRATCHLSCSTSLSAVTLALDVWLYNCAVMSNASLVTNLIKYTGNWAFSRVVLLFCSTLIYTSVWRWTFTFRIGCCCLLWYVNVALLLARELVKCLLNVFWTQGFLCRNDSMRLFSLNMSCLLLLLHQKLLVLQTLPNLRIFYCGTDLASYGLLMGRGLFLLLKAIGFLNLLGL